MNLSLKNTLLAVGVLALPLISTAVAGSSSVQDSRITTYGRISKKLASLSDQEIKQLLKEARPLGASGITGTVFCLELDGTKIFVKKLCLTDREQRIYGSTANIYELPLYYQYGVGSCGFGSQRETLAHKITTGWVLDGKCQNFPLLYHERVLEKSNILSPEQVSEVEKEIQEDVAYWNNSSAIKNRLEEMAHASTETVLFLEYIPHTLDKWWQEQTAQGIMPVTFAKIIKDLFEIAAFMNAHSMLHFDLHPGNILTDGQNLYIADFGLATSLHFELSDQELLFFKKHVDYDKSCTANFIVCGILDALFGENEDKKQAVLHEYATGNITTELPKDIAVVLTHYAPIAELMENFFKNVRQDKTAQYPETELKNLCIAAGLVN